MNRCLAALAGIVLLGSGGAAGATDVYRWVDDEGVTHYSQWRPDNAATTVDTLEIERSTPAGYDPAADPYSVSAQRARTHARWKDIHERAEAEREAARDREPDRAAANDDDAERYRPGYLFVPVLQRPFRVPERIQARQQAVLDEFDARGLKPAHSINSSVHRARIEARQQAVRATRRSHQP